MQQVLLLSLLLLTHNFNVQEIPAPTDESLKPIAFSAIPQRSHNAITGSQFAEKTSHMTGRERQKAALYELRKGNVPSFLRIFHPVKLTCPSSSITAVIWVAPDYLAIGSDSDFLRIPLSHPAAVTITSDFGCILPTRKMVDSIYRQSAFHYKPQPMKPGPMMRSSSYFLRHQRMIEGQGAGRPLGELVSGHKKDVVLTNRLWKRPGRVAIYGWHKLDGEPIQTLSTFHGAHYADYSHGIRLIHQTVLINGEYRSVFDVLDDPALAPVLTYEGVINDTRALMALNIRK